MANTNWEQLLERIESGMTTAADADAVRDLLEQKIDLETELAKFAVGADEFLDDDEDLIGVDLFDFPGEE